MGDGHFKIFINEKLESFKYKYREPQEKNICKTNATRILIYHYKMNFKNNFISKNKLNKHSQDIYINVNTPIMSVKCKEWKNVFNSKY